jgi:hypothetical protein
MSARKLVTIHYRKTGPPLKIVLRLAPLPNPAPNKGLLLNRALKKDLRPSVELRSDPLLKLIGKPGPLPSRRRKGKNHLASRHLTRNGEKYSYTRLRFCAISCR